jgi:hypothetical protein
MSERWSVDELEACFVAGSRHPGSQFIGAANQDRID